MLNHVLLHQTVIGLEAKEQLALAGEERPDVVIGSCGGGSNLGGISLPFLPDPDVRLNLAEAFQMTYDRGGYTRVMRYGRPLPASLPISPEDRAWAESVAR